MIIVELVETSKVYFVRRDDTRYDLVKGQLPDDVLEHKEIVISTENRAFLEEMQAQNESGVLQKKLQDTKNNTEQGVIAQQNNVMVGSHCKLTLGKGNHQMVAIRQDGSHNIVNVQIVPATTASKVLVVITTDPTNRELEKSIVQEVRADMEVVNICLSHYDGKLILIEEGSIVIELDVAPGKTIGFDYLQNVIGAIFQGNIKELVPEGTKFTVDAEVKNVIHLSKLQEYYSGYAVRDEDLHINCVNKDRYEDVLKQLESVTRELEDLKRKAEHDRTSFKEHGGLKVTIVSGDITDEETDVVVNSTNSQLLLSDGDLSGDILKAAGSSIQKECRKQNPSPLKVGDLAVTGGGKLSCKEIYHVVLSDKWLSQQKQTELSLRDVLKKCLHQADKSRHSSISFPALGMGNLQYDPEAVVPVMYDVILNFKPTALEEVRFVILPKCPEIRQIFSEKDKFKPLVRSQSEPADLEFGKHRTIQKMEIEDQPIVRWKIGDISHMKVDVVVNTTDKSLNLGSGPISQAVLKAAGKGVQEECRKFYPQGIGEGQLAITSGGELCKEIFHISLWPWTDECAMEEDFLDLIKSILEKAKEVGHRSIAFPMLGTGTLKYPPETVATWLSKTFDKETRFTTSLKTIYVVVHHKDLKNIEALKHIGKL